MIAGGLALSTAPALALPEAEPAKTFTKKTTPPPPGVFGSLELRTNARKSDAEWQRVFARIQDEAGTYKECDDRQGTCHPALRKWRNAIKRMKGLVGHALLSAVNVQINRLIRYRNDKRAFGKTDHWASPVESLTGFGDCEDFAILKYVTLTELGFSDERLKIVVVKDQSRGLGHAVLAVRTGTQIDILDNLAPQPLQHTEIVSYKPVYSVNRQGRWLNLAVRKRTLQLAESPTQVKQVKRPRRHDG